HDPVTKPLVLQLGGNEPDLLAQAGKKAAEAGFNGINLNVGCPSARVGKGGFGAWMMHDPARVHDCMHALAEAGLPVSVKCRIGITGRQTFDELLQFIDRVSAVGACRSFYIHARIAVLGGLSPKQNRTIPPLRHDQVFRLKAARSDLWIALNGGITRLDDLPDLLQHCDGVMIGRAAYRDPMMLAGADQMMGFGKDYPLAGARPEDQRLMVAQGLDQLCRQMFQPGMSRWPLIRHLGGLYYHAAGARRFRRSLGEYAACPNPDPHWFEAQASRLVT
ncbi:MAG: tRNA dihydrouridine(20/20a) synthase DusA, partial [Pseudomonadota bacterium]